MSSKYDSEDLLDSVLAIMIDGSALNNKITAIEAEKIADNNGVTPTLATIVDAAFYPQSWSAKILNHTPAVFYGIEDVTALDGGGAVAKTYKVFVEIVMVDSGQTNDVWRRIARYSRALEEIFVKAYAPAMSHGSVKVEQVRPIAFKLALDSDDEVKVGGVSLTVSLV